MKKIIFFISALLILFCSISQSAEAQNRKVENLPNYDRAPYHFGFILGINHMLFTVKTIDDLAFKTWTKDQYSDIFVDSLRVYGVTSSPTPGFTIGILGNLRLGNATDLRFIPSLSFGERVLNYQLMTWDDGVQRLIEVSKSITSTYVDFPLEVRYKSKRLNNFRAYVLGGVKYTLDLASQNKQAENAEDITVKINKNDVYAEIGAGVEFFTDYFKFGTQVKMGYGLNNLMNYENNIYSNSVESLRSKVFLLSFTFE